MIRNRDILDSEPLMPSDGEVIREMRHRAQTYRYLLQSKTLRCRIGRHDYTASPHLFESLIGVFRYAWCYSYCKRCFKEKAIVIGFTKVCNRGSISE